jgi:hypothetical protein
VHSNAFPPEPAEYCIANVKAVETVKAHAAGVSEATKWEAGPGELPTTHYSLPKTYAARMWRSGDFSNCCGSSG